VSGSFVATAHEARCGTSGSFGNGEARVRSDCAAVGSFVRTGLKACCASRVPSVAAGSGSFGFRERPCFVRKAPSLILPIFGQR